MRFALETETREFAGSVDRLLARADLPSVIRSWNDGDTAPGLTVWSKLAETGAFGLLVDESRGGMGASAVEAMAVLEVMGRHAVPGPLVETLMVAPVLLDGAGDRADALAGSITGGEPVTVACPPLSPYAADPGVASALLVATGDEVWAGSAGDVLPSVDRARTVTLPERTDRLGSASTERALDHGALGTSALLLGLATAMLRMSVDYATQRTQFGRVIGEFQALKHKMAEVAIAVEMARPLLWAGALALGDTETSDTDTSGADTGSGRPAALDVSAAKVACSDAAALAARHALQVHGGIGYTLEHDLGLLLTRARALRSAWGTPDAHRGRVLAALDAGQGARP